MNNEENPTRVTIIGLGLLGASLGAALRQAGRWYVVGYDADASANEQAVGSGSIDASAGTIDEAVADATLVVLATPVDAMSDVLDAIVDAAPDGCTVMDLGSTKRQVVTAMEALPPRLRAIGGHPMAGRKTANVDRASASLFEARTFVLVACANTDAVAADISRRLVADIGAEVVEMSAAQHDRILALVSHVPHFLAVPYVLATEDAGDPAAWVVAAGGFQGIAASNADNPTMWDAIEATNADEIAHALRHLARHIEAFASALDADDGSAAALIERARALYEQHGERT